MTSTSADYIPLNGGNNGALTSMGANYSSSLPILVLITDGAITHSHAQKTTVNAYLASKSGESYSLSSVESATGMAGDMRIRGQSTGGTAKAQYSFSLREEPSENFMGMPFNGKHWVLNDIGVQDYSLLRDPLAFHLQRELGGVQDAVKGELNCWAPRHQYCQLFVYQKSATNMKTDSEILTDIVSSPNLTTGGGFYRGLYLLLEKIHHGDSRVHTKILDKPTDTPHTESGGLIFQINPTSTFTTTQGTTGDWYLPLQKFSSFSTEPNNLYEPKAHVFYELNEQTPANLKYENYLSLINKWWDQWVTSDYASTCDHHSFAVYFLINEIANDPDGYHKSTFMYKKYDKVETSTINAGPLWDKDKSFGNPNNVFDGENGWNYVRDNPPMWSALLADKDFCSKIWSLWNYNPLFFTTDPAPCAGWEHFIDTQAANLATGNIITDNGALWGTPADTSQWNSQVSTLKTAVRNRISWINENLPTLLEKSGFSTQ